MNNTKIYFVALLGLFLAAGSRLLNASPGTTAPPARDVVVTNTSANPVPVENQGTTNVAGSVNISNTPNVNVANSPTVQVNTSAENPLLARDVDNPARQAYEASANFHPILPGTAESCAALPAVPASKRLVIQYVFAEFSLQQFEDVVTLALFTKVNDVTLKHPLDAHHVDLHNPQINLFRVSQQLQIYADPGYTPSICLTLDPALGVDQPQAVISGYLIDMP